MSNNHLKRRRSDGDDDLCPMTPDQIEIMMANQAQLMKDMADIKKYLFAGRVVIGTLVFIGFSFDWFRDHVAFIKAWVSK